MAIEVTYLSSEEAGGVGLLLTHLSRLVVRSIWSGGDEEGLNHFSSESVTLKSNCHWSLSSLWESSYVSPVFHEVPLKPVSVDDPNKTTIYLPFTIIYLIEHH